MADVHAFTDVLKTFEDVVQFVVDAKARGWKVGFGDIGTLMSLLGDVKAVVADVPDFKNEATAATVSDYQALAGRAVADIVALLKAVA